MTNSSHPAAARVVTAAVVALLLGACGGTTTGSTTATTSPAAAATTSSAAPVGTSVGVIESEFSITLDATSFTAGTYTFTVKNKGSFAHNLTIEGPGVDKVATPTLPGGQSGSVTVSLQKGSYELWCSVDSHKDKGMDMKITVG
ncbi:MAG: plastocyanin/azurin family copper-binding protein [Actinomycetota bacterium]